MRFRKYLCEHEKIDVVVIAPDVEDQEQVGIQLRQPTIRMQPETSAKDIVWEMSNLFPDAPPKIRSGLSLLCNCVGGKSVNVGERP